MKIKIKIRMEMLKSGKCLKFTKYFLLPVNIIFHFASIILNCWFRSTNLWDGLLKQCEYKKNCYLTETGKCFLIYNIL